MSAARCCLFAMTSFAILASVTLPARASDSPPYTVTERVRLGGVGGWDYLTMDTGRHRLFITRGDRVDVLDVRSGKLVGSVGGIVGAHGVALAPDLKRGFVSNGKGNAITEFDYDTLAVLRTAPVPGLNPDAIVYDAATGHLYTFNGKSADVTVFDAKTLTLAAKFPVPGKPEFARADASGHLYVNIETSPGMLVRINTAKMAVDATWTLEGCMSPTGLALDGAHQRLFSVCDDGVMAVTDASTGRAVARVSIGTGPDAAEFDPERGLVFSSNGADGTLTVVREDSPDRYTVLAQVPTQKGARTMAFDPESRRIYLVTADFEPAPAGSKSRPAAVPESFTLLVASPR